MDDAEGSSAPPRLRMTGGKGERGGSGDIGYDRLFRPRSLEGRGSISRRQVRRRASAVVSHPPVMGDETATDLVCILGTSRGPRPAGDVAGRILPRTFRLSGPDSQEWEMYAPRSRWLRVDAAGRRSQRSANEARIPKPRFCSAPTSLRDACGDGHSRADRESVTP